MQLREIIQRVQSLYSKGVQTDDTRLTPRHIYSKLLTVRILLIFQKINKKQQLSDWSFQTLPCVEMITAPAHECPCLPSVGCKILRSKHPLPKPIEGINGHLIRSVNSIDGSILYDEISWNAYKNKKGSKYTSQKPDFFIRNDHIYITHRRGPKVLSITGIFEDPVEAETYPSFCKEVIVDPCRDIQDMEFPIDGNLIEGLLTLTNEELLRVFKGLSQDRRNNSRDDNQQHTEDEEEAQDG